MYEENGPLKTLKVEFSKKLYVCETHICFIIIINGIIINDKEHQISQYADDTLFLLDGTSKPLNETLNILSELSRFSGLKVNFDKTHAV